MYVENVSFFLLTRGSYEDLQY